MSFPLLELPPGGPEPVLLKEEGREELSLYEDKDGRAERPVSDEGGDTKGSDLRPESSEGPGRVG